MILLLRLSIIMKDMTEEDILMEDADENEEAAADTLLQFFKENL